MSNNFEIAFAISLGFCFLVLGLLSYIFFTKKNFVVVKRQTFIVVYIGSCFILFHLKNVLLNLLKQEVLEYTGKNFLVILGQLLVTCLQCLIVVEIKKTFPKLLSCALLQLVFCFVLFGTSKDIGIIKPVYYFLFIMAMMGYLFVDWVFMQLYDLLESTRSTNNRNIKVEVYNKVQSEANRILKIILQAILGLGASLGVAMTILYKNGSFDWTKPDNSNSALTMLISFGLIVLGFAIWLGNPYLDIILKLKEEYKKLIIASESKIIKG